MNTNKILTSVFICLLLVVAILFYILKGPQTGIFSQNLTPSSDILYFTMPVMSFAGTVEKIEGNTMILTQKVTLQQRPPVPIALPGTTVSPIPTPIQKIITLKVQFDKNVVVSKYPETVFYLFKKVTPTMEKPSINDVRPGLRVSVMTDSDLRLASSTLPKAVSITIQPVSGIVSGKITDVKNNILTMRGISLSTALPGQSVTAKETDYTVTVTDDTEISRNEFSTPAVDPSKMVPPTPVKVSLSELKKDMQITVYTNVDVTTTTSLTALRIEPQVPVVLPTGLPITALPQATPTAQ